jgi:hypothetical protein
MINSNRIVPVMKTDLISLYGLILKQDSNNSGLVALASSDIEGNYQIKTNSAVLIADQPVVSCDIDATGSSVSACTLYFIADPAFTGFTIDGVAETPASGSVDVVAGSADLYKAVLASGDITITKVGF